jgi:hypothetical protein
MHVQPQYFVVLHDTHVQPQYIVVLLVALQDTHVQPQYFVVLHTIQIVYNHNILWLYTI